MRLTHESTRARWLILAGAWALCALLILTHGQSVRDYVAKIDQLGQRDGKLPDTPLRQVIPARYSDAQMWVRHVLAAEENGEARVRFTHADNAPDGREVHWSSAFAWLLRGAARLHGAITGEPPARALEHTLLWFDSALFLAVVVLFSAWTARRAGTGAGLLVPVAMVGHPRFYEGFAPVYVDHHGVITAAVFGLVLGIVFMGVGWWMPGGTQPRLLPERVVEARAGAIVSATSGAIGMWVSAASVVPAIALIGIAAVLVAWWHGSAARRQGPIFEPTLWRTWGRVGAALSLALYFVEYAPSHFSWRLEANHPVYALAWWGGAELVATLGAWLVARGEAPDGKRQRERADAPRRPHRVMTVLAVMAVLAPVLVILVGGRRVFLVSDPFVGEMRHFVAEGISFAAALRIHGFNMVAPELCSTLVLLPAAYLLARRRDESRLVLGFATLLAAGLFMMSFAEARWWMTSSATQLALVLVVVAVAVRQRWCGAWLGVTLAAAIFIVPAVRRVARENGENRRGAVAATDLQQPLWRDIAAALRADQPTGDIVLLASPNASAGIGYFGRFSTVGTLYWENVAGLRAAAEIFCAATDDEALRFLQARRITHVAMLPQANFVGEYHRLLHPQRPAAEGKMTFGYRLLSGRPPPPWLQPIPYRAPADLESAGDGVRLFKLAVDAPAHEHLYRTAIAQLAAGSPTAAEAAVDAGLDQIAPAERAALLEAIGGAFYEHGVEAGAVRLLRRAFDLAPDPNTANLMAWILATTRDDGLRDGRAALALAEPILRENPRDPTALSTFAASCAEVGRFAEAVAAAERACAAVRASGDRETEAVLERRAAAYRSGKPWRQ